MTEKKPGDVRTPLKWWDTFGKSVVGIDHQGTRYEVEVDFFEWENQAALYRDSKLVEQSGTPAKFELGDGARIEVDVSSFGIKYARLVTPEGTIPVSPLPESFEYKRLRWDEANPGAARIIAATSWIVLAVAAIVGVPQILELISGTNIADRIGFSFTSPINPPGSVNTALTVLALVAASERGTRMKYNWWLEGLSDDVFFE